MILLSDLKLSVLKSLISKYSLSTPIFSMYVLLGFNIDFNSSDKVSINILSDGLIKCYEQEYETWEGKNTLAYKSDRDMRYFTIHVKYHGKNLAQRVCEVSNIRLTQDNQAGETAIHVGSTEQQSDVGDIEHDTSGYAIMGLVLMVVAVVMAVVCGIVLFVKRRFTI